MMSSKILSLDETLARCRALRDRSGTVVLTNGCFDVLHIGHVRYLQRARELGDALVVALNGDDAVRALKGPGRPINGQEERAEVLAALACVDYVTIFHDLLADRVVQALRPDVYVKGGDYARSSAPVPEASIVADYGGLVVFLDVETTCSTSTMIERIVERSRRGLLAAREPVAGGVT